MTKSTTSSTKSATVNSPSTKRGDFTRKELAQIQYRIEHTQQPYREIAAAFNATEGTIKSLRHKHGWKPRANQKKYNPEGLKADAAITTGMTVTRLTKHQSALKNALFDPDAKAALVPLPDEYDLPSDFPHDMLALCSNPAVQQAILDMVEHTLAKLDTILKAHAIDHPEAVNVLKAVSPGFSTRLNQAIARKRLGILDKIQGQIKGGDAKIALEVMDRLEDTVDEFVPKDSGSNTSKGGINIVFNLDGSAKDPHLKDVTDQ